MALSLGKRLLLKRHAKKRRSEKVKNASCSTNGCQNLPAQWINVDTYECFCEACAGIINEKIKNSCIFVELE